MRHARSFLALLPLLVVTAGCSEPAFRSVFRADGEVTVDKDGDLYEQGKRQFAAGKYAEAAATFRRVVAKNPRDVGALNALGASYDRLRRYDLAERQYERALALAPDDAQTLNNYGYSFLMRGRSREAAMMFEKAAHLAPSNKMIEANLGILEKQRQAASAPPPAEPQQTAAPEPALQRNGIGTWLLDVAKAEEKAALPKLVGVLPSVQQAEPVAIAAIEHPPAPEAAPRESVAVVGLLEPPPVGKPTSVAAPPRVLASMQVPAIAAPAATPAVTPISWTTPPTTTVAQNVACRLEISNGTGNEGAAGEMRRWLLKHGVASGCLSNLRIPATIDHSVILYQPRLRTEAERLSALLPGIPLQASSGIGNEIVLILGRNQEKPKSKGNEHAI